MLSELILTAVLGGAIAGCADNAPPAREPSAPPIAHAAAPSTRGEELLGHLTASDPRLKDAALEIAATGDETLRRAAAARLVAAARALVSAGWRDEARAEVQQANAQARLEPTAGQLEAQLDLYRDQKLTGVLAGMETIGGAEIVAYAFALAEDEAAALDLRRAAVAVLVRHVEASDAEAVSRRAAVTGRVVALTAMEAASPAARARVSNIASVTAGVVSGFRRCYNTGLQVDPDMKGSVRLVMRIGPIGQVVSATPEDWTGLSSAVVECLLACARDVVFRSPEGGSATVVIPVRFTNEPPPAAKAPRRE